MELIKYSFTCVHLVSVNYNYYLSRATPRSCSPPYPFPSLHSYTHTNVYNTSAVPMFSDATSFFTLSLFGLKENLRVVFPICRHKPLSTGIF